MNNSEPVIDFGLPLATPQGAQGEKPIEKVNVKALLIVRGVKQAVIASKHGMPKSLVSRVVNGTRKTQRVREIIAKELDMPVEALWP